MAGELRGGALSALPGQKASGTQALSLQGHSTELPILLVSSLAMNQGDPLLAIGA